MPTRILVRSDDNDGTRSSSPRHREIDDENAALAAAGDPSPRGGGTMTGDDEEERERSSAAAPIPGPVTEDEDGTRTRNTNQPTLKDYDDNLNAVEVVKSLLGSKVECRLKDGRTVSGRLVCVDRLSNVILADCWEERTVFAEDYHPVADDDVEDGKEQAHDQHCRVVKRQLAQAMIPGPALVSVTMDRSAYEKAREKNSARGMESAGATSTGTAGTASAATDGGR